jgi:hypothetical protein
MGFLNEIDLLKIDKKISIDEEEQLINSFEKLNRIKKIMIDNNPQMVLKNKELMGKFIEGDLFQENLDNNSKIKKRERKLAGVVFTYVIYIWFGFLIPIIYSGILVGELNGGLAIIGGIIFWIIIYLLLRLLRRIFGFKKK